MVGKTRKVFPSYLKSSVENMNLDEAKNAAIVRMLDDAHKNGANTVIEVLIDYNSIGGIKGSAIDSNSYWTAVIYE
jgi:uncharacterized protein YbjQ (UPF0145 family)